MRTTVNPKPDAEVRMLIGEILSSSSFALGLLLAKLAALVLVLGWAIARLVAPRGPQPAPLASDRKRIPARADRRDPWR
jgi:hypothetical protein